MAYRSALDPLILNLNHAPLTVDQEQGPLKTSGLFDALHLAADLVGFELADNRVEGLNQAPEDRKYMRLAVNFGNSDAFRTTSLFGRDEIWNISCSRAQEAVGLRPDRAALEPSARSPAGGAKACC